jgi:uncharacterized protein (DUF58 family)
MQTPDLYSAAPAPAPAADTAVASLQSQINTLRALLNVVLLILLLMSLAANALLLKQVGKVRSQVEASQPQVDKLSTEYENVLKPRISQFLQALVQFAQTNPDFIPILQKYPIQSQAAPASQVPQPPAR